MLKKVPVIVWVVIGFIIAIIIGRIILKSMQAGYESANQTSSDQPSGGKTLINCEGMSDEEKRQVMQSGNYACK